MPGVLKERKKDRRSAIGGTRPSDPPLLMGEALEQAFPNLSPRQRLALVSEAVKVEAASQRRRRRLARTAKKGVAAWLILVLAGALCAAVGFWNYRTSQGMLAQLDARLPASASGATADSLPPWSPQRLVLAADYILREARHGTPPPWLPRDGMEQLRTLSVHRQRYLTYETIGLSLVALGGLVLTGASAMLIARRH